MSVRRARRRARGGTYLLLATDEDGLARAFELALELSAAPATRGETRAFGPHEAYWKANRLAPRSALRHGVRRALLGRAAPRVREFHNLRWLRERLFRAPEPLATGVRFEHGLPREQFLVTATVPGEPFAPSMERAGAPARAALLEELAREVARMHALHFVHRDLFPRNLLVGPPDEPRRIVFLDAWAGGPQVQTRGPAYDVASLLLEGAEDWTEREQAAFLDAYFDESGAQGRTLDRARFAGRVTAQREGLLDRLEREPARLRGRALPRRDWRAPSP